MQSSSDCNPDYDRFSGIGSVSRLRCPLFRPLYEAVSYTHLDVYKRQGLPIVVAASIGARCLSLELKISQLVSETRYSSVLLAEAESSYSLTTTPKNFKMCIRDRSFSLGVSFSRRPFLYFYINLFIFVSLLFSLLNQKVTDVKMYRRPQNMRI